MPHVQVQLHITAWPVGASSQPTPITRSLTPKPSKQTVFLCCNHRTECVTTFLFGHALQVLPLDQTMLSQLRAVLAPY